MLQSLGNFKEAIQIQIGSGKKTQFWNDVWCTNRPLKLEAPHIYEITSNKTVKLADCKCSNRGNGWNIPLRMNLNDWEINEMAYLIGLMENTQLRDDRKDSRCWILYNNGKLSVKTCYQLYGDVGYSSSI